MAPSKQHVTSLAERGAYTQAVCSCGWRGALMLDRVAATYDAEDRHATPIAAAERIRWAYSAPTPELREDRYYAGTRSATRQELLLIAQLAGSALPGA